MNFESIIAKYYSEAFSEKAKGQSFEKLMLNFLKTYPVYENKFTKVWLWNECPFRHSISPSGKDIGIDLVALTDDGNYWAVQCKCHKRDSHIDKRSLDSFLAVSGKSFTDENGVDSVFAARLWISTTNNWSSEAENEIKNQTIPFVRISLYDLETAPVDWELLDKGLFGQKAKRPQKSLMDHQKKALMAAIEHYKTHDRGRLSMCCGSGKTFTSLRIAECQTQGKGLTIFFAPSIALIGQSLREWTADAAKPIYPVCVCSDADVSKTKIKSEEDAISGVADLALPATTVPETIVKQLRFGQAKHPDRLQVIFSTYQSIDKVSAALKLANVEVDLIVCDEAHRTTGVTLAGMDESHFVKVHDNSFIKAKKRLYMTATPRIYHSDVKTRANEQSVILCSMDDELLYGQEFHHLGFGEAVSLNLLCDYKVLVLTVNRWEIPDEVQAVRADGKKEIDTDDVTKLIGCINALSKNMDFDGKVLLEADPVPMRKAVAFCRTIAQSKLISGYLNEIKERCLNRLDQTLIKNADRLVEISADHIDGTMGASVRDGKMAWLKEPPENDNKCRILTNVKCLSEGVDVPTLDAVIFLSAKNSEIEVVQSVGRVMRNAPSKKFGFIVIPVLVPSYVDPNDALNDNKPYEVVWTVLNALKSHDDRFRATINKIQFNEKRPDGGGSFLIGGLPRPDSPGDKGLDVQKAKVQDILEEVRKRDTALHNSLYARLVKKVGFKEDLLLWASDVAKIAEDFIILITKVVNQPGPHKERFEKFLGELRNALNPSVETADAIEMLAQHLITKPVFEALFEDHYFVKNNPVSMSLESMIDVLEDQGLEKYKVTLTRFYETVKDEVAGIDTPEAKQKIIVKLYDNFFKIAMPKAAEKLGIVYTPVEIVDFINNSVAKVLKKEFGRNISDPNVHILDPFTGTGTFISRLIQSGLLGTGEKLTNKYSKELHANELILLAYYIASVNIENAYHAAIGEKTKYKPFNGICLTDTFQLTETDNEYLQFKDSLKQNFDRVNIQRKSPITVILGNPPYSVGQRSANDNAQNLSYPHLEKLIELTYGAKSRSNLLKSLYDTYIKAFCWSTNRLDPKTGGIIAFVSNAGWLDGNAMDGMRKCLAEEFSKIYVFNLRGNQRTLGDLSRREGGKIFGRGSRTPIAITILVKHPGHQGQADIFHHDIGDYLTKEQKLAIISEKQDIYDPSLTWEKIEPNDAGDWLNQRTDEFENYFLLGDKTDKKNIKTFFKPFYSLGVVTNRDAWCYNYSNHNLQKNIKLSIDFYNDQVLKIDNIKLKGHKTDLDKFIEYDSTAFSWDRQQKKDVIKSKQYIYSDSYIYISMYRPFSKQYLFFNRNLNNCVYLMPRLFPTQNHKNLVICVSGIGVTKEFSAIISNIIPDLELIGKSQCFPRYYYEEGTKKQHTLFSAQTVIDGYTRHDGITDWVYQECKTKYGPKVTKDTIFWYVYGLLHSEDYRKTYSDDLKKSLPRLPLVDNPEDFWAFSKGGEELARLHLNYETVEPYAKVTVTGEDKGNFSVDKIRFVDKRDKSAIQFNPGIRITGIPLEAYDYVVNGRSAIEWIMDRYQVTVDKDSGIKNDPNDWAKETNQPRYILDLLLKVITVSLKTLDITNKLPKLQF